MARTSVCAAMVLGRAPDEQRLVKEAFARATLPMETTKASSETRAALDRRLLARAAREWRDPMLVVREVRVRVAREERSMAEVAMGGRRKEVESRWVCTIKEEEESEEEMFPSFGPYQCEICQEITETKQLFVNHIRRLHRGEVDTQVLSSLESDLRKKERREERNLNNVGIKVLVKGEPVIKRKKPSREERRKKVKRKKIKHSKCESEEEYVPKKRKASMAGEERRSRSEVEGGSWEQEKEELDPPTLPSGYSVASLLGSGRSITTNTSSTSFTTTTSSSITNTSSTSYTTNTSSTSDTTITPCDTISTDSSATDTTYNYKASITKRYEAELNGGEEVKDSKPR